MDARDRLRAQPIVVRDECLVNQAYPNPKFKDMVKRVKVEYFDELKSLPGFLWPECAIVTIAEIVIDRKQPLSIDSLVKAQSVREV